MFCFLLWFLRQKSVEIAKIKMIQVYMINYDKEY